jgi:hypothetical protein
MSDKGKKYLVDANTLITPYQNYYSFDMYPQVWIFMKEKIQEGMIIILDKVYNEVTIGDDDLSTWLRGIDQLSLLKHKDRVLLTKYSNVMEYIQTCGFYTDRGLKEWADDKCADAWLVAAAMASGYTIVTFETPVGNLNKKQPSSHPKIPDICNHFNIRYDTLYTMMRELGFNR